MPAARFPLWEAQEQFLGRIKGYTDRWQPDGLGRVYLDATLAAPPGHPARVEATAEVVPGRGGGRPQPGLAAGPGRHRQQVRRQRGGQVAWQNAALLLAPRRQRAFLAGQPVATLPLDADALLQLRHLGIRTLGQYARLPATGVLTRFGQAGRTAQRWAQGLDDRPVRRPGRRRSRGPAGVRDALGGSRAPAGRAAAPGRPAAGPAARPAPGRGPPAARITRADGRTIPLTHTFPQPTAAAEPVRLALAGLLERVPWDGQGAAEITLTLAGITDTPAQQLTLFDPHDDNRARLSALDRLAARFGADAFRLASLADPDNLLLERRAAFAAVAM